MLSTRINPFKPSAGHLPPVLIGRDMVLADFEEGLDNGSGAPGRLMRITGARGVGKTVMLAEFRRIAEKRLFGCLCGCESLTVPTCYWRPGSCRFSPPHLSMTRAMRLPRFL